MMIRMLLLMSRSRTGGRRIRSEGGGRDGSEGPGDRDNDSLI